MSEIREALERDSYRTVGVDTVFPDVIAGPVYLLTDGVLPFAFCPDCYPMLGLSAERMHSGHYRRGFAGCSRLQVWESGVLLDRVEEAYELPDTPGLMLRECVPLHPGDSRILLCKRNGHITPLVRLRYSPYAEIRCIDYGDSS